VLQLTKSYVGAAQATYRLALVSGAVTTRLPAAQIAELQLVANPDVVNASNVFHQYADHGLDLLQAALVVKEPQLKSNAEALLFPAPSAAGTELVIQAVLDWVAFTKRRETQCRREVVVAPALPPRRYRVLNYLLETAQAAQAFATMFKDLPKRADAIEFLLSEDRKAQHGPLVVTFAGGSATAESNLADARADWNEFKPGDQIYYSAAGALGETDPSLQLKRLQTFLGAITDASSEVEDATEDAIIPWPQEVTPEGADGVILIVSVMKLADREAIQVYGADSTMFHRLVDAAKNDQLQPGAWQSMLAKATNLGTASFTPGGPLDVDSAAVQSNFHAMLPNQVIEESLLLVDKNEATGNVDRVASVQKVVSNLGSNAPAPTIQVDYGGTWFANTPSVLILRCINNS
jgi:hypothetical protein